MKKTSLRGISLVFLLLLVLTNQWVFSQSHPFPANVTYNFGLMATNRNSQDALSNYNTWKTNFLEQCSNGRYRVKFDDRSQTVSEGIGYGMLLSAYAGDRTIFDGLWNYYKDNSNGNGVMNWKINGCSGVAGANGATDGDLDAAMALIVAYYQWGAGGTINYQNDAKTLINNIKSHEVESGSNVVKPGDQFGGSSNTNPSYFAPGYFRVFATFNNDASWNTIAEKCYDVINKNLTVNNAAGGFVSDWCQANGSHSGGSGNYSYDAARTPWRISVDYVWNGNANAKAYIKKASDFVRVNLGGSQNVKDGYSQGGSAISSNHNSTFTGAFACAAMGGDVQSHLDNSYSDLKGLNDANSYFNQSLKTLYLFLLSGNFYLPGGTVIITPPPVESPYGGTAWPIPGKIEAENYDLGGSGLAYNDATSGNQGGAYRTDDVDIEATTDAGGGYDVGYTAAGEWLNYTVNVANTGKYDFNVRVASNAVGKSFHIEMNGVNVTGAIAVPNTGGWQTWQTVTVPNISLTAGASQIMKIAMDTDGFNFNYVTVNSSVVAVNQPPTVSISGPANNATFTAPATVTITANAADADGTVSKVEFYNGTTLLGTSTTAPYSFTWTNVASGNYSITAKATDNLGLTTTSTTVFVTINPPANQPPTVSITSPANNFTQTIPVSVTFTAAAADADGTISKVEFYNGTTLIGTATSAPYTIVWSNVLNSGTYTITAKATDNAGASTTSAAITVILKAPNQAPSVSVTSPLNNATFTAPASITITANAADADGTVSKVEFYNGTTLLGSSTTAPYSFTWTNVSSGTYSVTAKATDNLGLATTSTAVSVTVNPPANQPPTVSITSPANNFTQTIPVSVTFTAAAADADGTISKVEFYNGTTLIGTATSAPYTIVWSNVLNSGTYTITAKATDNLGASTTSAAITVILKAPNQAPSVSVTSPLNNATFTAPASVTINASASDPDGTVSKVEFYNGTTLLGSSSTAPYSLTWTNVASGTYSITAKATDNLGLATTSTAVSVTVNTSANQPPTVSVTNPLNNAVFTAPASIAISANATDADGSVSKVEFYNGTALLGTFTAAPYTITWSSVVAGTYSITAKATDNSGATTISNVVSVIVNSPANLAPTVSIITPLNNATFTAPASVSITANAADADGTVSKVEFYNGTTLLGSSTSAPYGFSWTGVGTGTYNITAKAIDNAGSATVSTAVSVTVNTPANQAPTVSIITPLNNATFTAPASVSITANAADADGTVSKVEFYNGTTLLGASTISPYSFTWTNVVAGTYSITAKATDNSGAATTSSAVSVTVNAAQINLGPTVSITSPVNNQTFTTPATVNITANAADADGTVSKVDFYEGTNLLGSSTSAPYSFSWTYVIEGTYSISAKATDNSGATTTSAAVTVVVSSPIVGCILNAIPSASQWIVRNDWSDQYSGSAVSNTPDALQVSQRAWGNANLWVIESGQTLSVTNGQSYTISFDFKNDATLPVNSIDVGLGSAINWNGPQLVQPAVSVPSGFSSSSYTTKTVTFTSSVTGNVYLGLKLNLAGQPNATVNTYIKNLQICGGAVVVPINPIDTTSGGTYLTGPNPFDNQTTVKITDANTVQLRIIMTNSSGMNVWDSAGLQTNQTIYLGSGLPGGVYTVTGFYAGKTVSFKIIKN